jgi:hypothetical protein
MSEIFSLMLHGRYHRDPSSFQRFLKWSFHRCQQEQAYPRGQRHTVSAAAYDTKKEIGFIAEAEALVELVEQQQEVGFNDLRCPT